MELQASRIGARTDSDSGAPITLREQNRSRWDWLLIECGLAALTRADALPGARGPYAIQAAIAACHARSRIGDQTDWHRILALYDALAILAPSPIVELNRPVTVSMADGPADGLPLLDAIADDPPLSGYHLLPAVRGDLLSRLGHDAEAAVEFECAAAMTNNDVERELLVERALRSSTRAARPSR